jgi:uncharacterized protein
VIRYLRNAVRALSFAILVMPCTVIGDLGPSGGSSSAAAVNATNDASYDDVQMPAAGGDIPRSFNVPVDGYDYIKREVMVAMRDGVRLNTIIVVPRGSSLAPPMTRFVV